MATHDEFLAELDFNETTAEAVADEEVLEDVLRKMC